MNKLEKDKLRLVLNNKYGPGPKFLANYLIEIEKINETSIKEGYKEKQLEFYKICDEFLLNSSRQSSSNAINSDASPILNAKKTTDAALVQKFKTPMSKKTNGIFTIKPSIIDLIGEDEPSQDAKTRKRSALLAEISVLADDNSLDEQEEDIIKTLFKSDDKKKSKLKPKKKGDKKNDDENNTEETTSKNPSKKSKVIESEAQSDEIIKKKPKRETDDPVEQENDDAATTKKTTKKKKTTKTSDVEDVEEEKKAKKSKKGKKSKLETEETKKTEPKTPVASNQQKARLELLQSTVKKTIKKRPLTRRAAAAAQAAAEAAKPKPVPSLSKLPVAPSTLKKVNKFEFDAKNDAKTPSVNRNRVIANLQLTASKLRPNFRTSIDERKARTSQAKLELKRKSVKKAQAILKSIQSERKVSTNLNNISDDNIEQNLPKTSKLSIEKEKELINNLLKSGSPKLVIHKIPSSLINASASKIAVYTENQRRLTKELMSSNTIQQNYRVLQPSTSKMTPSRNNIQPPMTNQNRTSFVKFLERNTPSKLTRTELEEKQKVDLKLKEAKEKDRLAIIEKQKQEKLDEKKKIRDEKMRKIQELKAKQQDELDKKKREQLAANQEQQKKPPPTSNSCLNFNQLKNQNVSTLSASTSNLAQQAKPKPKHTEQNDLSTFGSEFNNFKQINNKIKQGSLAYHPENDNYNMKNLCETTYVLNSPSNNKGKEPLGKSTYTNYQVTPLQPPKLKNEDNYDVSDLRSEDDTDDEEEPSKPLPDWARDPGLTNKVKLQAKSMFNFTKVFKSASQSEIILEDIFKTRRKKFTERSSSAIWTTSPVWKSNGISGEESFWQFKKHY